MGVAISQLKSRAESPLVIAITEKAMYPTQTMTIGRAMTAPSTAGSLPHTRRSTRALTIDVIPGYLS